MELAEALKEAKEQMSQAICLCESSPGVYNTGLQSVYEKKSAMLSCLIYGIESLQAENEMLKANQVECCKLCSQNTPFGFCCLKECNEHEFCRSCILGERRVEE